MIFSKAWSYVVRALIYLQEHREEGPILSTIIAQQESIPRPYLVKLLGELAAEGVVSSTRGRGGGFELLADPNSLKLKEITAMFDRPVVSSSCIFGYGKCESTEKCPIHEKWKGPQGYIDKFLEETSLADLCKVPDNRFTENNSILK